MSDEPCDGWFQRPLTWRKSGDVIFPYRVESDVTTLVVRLNDFPVEQHYTLLVNGREVCSFDDWPAMWVRPD